MKKIIILLLFVLISCGKSSSVHNPGPKDWSYGNNFHKYQEYNNYNGFYTNIIGNPLGRWGLHDYWKNYSQVAFYFMRYECWAGFCNRSTVGQDGKEFFNIYSKVLENSTHPFLKITGGINGGFINLFKPYPSTLVPKVGYAENGLAYWVLFTETDAEIHRIGINPSYPIWANPVMEEWVNKYSGKTTGYYLNYWLF